MATQRTVQAGECISTIAAERGLSPDTLWNHPSNAELKSKRQDPNTLCPGDIVFVPDLRERDVQVATGAMHRFQILNTPAIFRVQVFDDDEPRANQQYELYLDQIFRKGVTDGDGNLEQRMLPSTATARLIIGPDRAEFRFTLGALQPPAEIKGMQARLANLGFACRQTGEIDDETTACLRDFQDFAGLTQTGQYDGATRAELEKLHDRICGMPGDGSSADEPADEQDDGSDPGPDEAEE